MKEQHWWVIVYVGSALLGAAVGASAVIFFLRHLLRMTL